MTYARFSVMMKDLFDEQGAEHPTEEQLWLDWQDYEMEREQMQNRYSQ